MPYSSVTGKNATVAWFRDNESSISRILDIGVGCGTYLHLIKETNQLCMSAKWVGIEVWQPYISQFNLVERYDTIINRDVRTIDWENMGKFSMAIAGDVLEHMSKDEAIALVNSVLTVSDGLLISIPIMVFEQGEYEGNPYEAHIKSDWSHDEVLATWGHLIKEMAVEPGSDLGVYILRKSQ
jgi:predicted TPR repeat methyltransferase